MTVVLCILSSEIMSIGIEIIVNRIDIYYLTLTFFFFFNGAIIRIHNVKLLFNRNSA